mmetsp:Transcript_11494/g.24505  ORF Transcript_11494/g.24505 Transcript_11494/m.24505 type:complete len:259 (+) Transcript_11494:3223-3999(+)
MQEAIKNGRGSLIRLKASVSKDCPMDVALVFFFGFPSTIGRVETHFSNRKGLLLSSSSFVAAVPFLSDGASSSSTMASICDNPTPCAARFLRASRSVHSSLGMVTYRSNDDKKSSDTTHITAVWPAADMDGTKLGCRRNNEVDGGALVALPPREDAGDADSCVPLPLLDDVVATGNSAIKELYASIRTTYWCCVKQRRKHPFISYKFELHVLLLDLLPEDDATAATPSNATNTVAAYFLFSTSAEKSAFFANKKAWST